MFTYQKEKEKKVAYILIIYTILICFGLYIINWVWNNKGFIKLKIRNKIFNVLFEMDAMFESYLGSIDGSIEPDDIPKTNEPVWILGKKYSAIQGNLLYINRKKGINLLYN